MTRESLLKALEERATCAHRLASSAEDCISKRMWYLQFDTYKNSIDFVNEHLTMPAKSVSLMDCARALQGNERIKLGSDLQAIAKIVLDIARVKYRD